MKSVPTVAAVTIAMALLLVPLATSAAGTLTISSPASGASYKGSQAYTISGTVSPAPTQADNVGIVVSNPNGATVDQGNVAVTNGAFSYSTAVGGTSAWITGTYTISAVDTFGASATASFTYTSSTTSFNMTRALINIQGNLTIINNEIKALQASEATEQADMKANFTALSSAISTLSGTVSGMSSTLTTLSTSVTGISSQLTSLTNTVGQINSAVGTLGSQVTTAANNAQSAANAVSSTQTYVLVVAVLAAITLVLELAILVRKIS